MSPFQALYGRPPPHLVRIGSSSTAMDHLDQLLLEREAMLDEIQFNLVRAQQIMKFYVDTKRRELSFEVGDLVFLKLQPYRQQSLAKRPNAKLAPRFFGPYMVKQKVGKVAYLLDLPPQSQIHPVFHVSQLKPARGYTTPSDAPLPVTHGLILDASSSALLAIRHPTPSQTEVLV